MNLIQALLWNVGTCILMLRERFKWKPHKNLSTDTVYRGGLVRSSEEGAVMAVERRDQVIRFIV